MALFAPSVSATCTGRISTVLSGLTDIDERPPSGWAGPRRFGTDVICGMMAGVEHDIHILSGPQRQIGIRYARPAVAMVPEAVSTLESTKSSVPLPDRRRVAVLGQRHPRFCCGLASALCSSARLLSRQVEVDLQRIDLRDRHPAGVAVLELPLLTVTRVADRNIHRAQSPGNRCRDRGKAELNIVGIDRRLVGRRRSPQAAFCAATAWS